MLKKKNTFKPSKPSKEKGNDKLRPLRLVGSEGDSLSQNFDLKSEYFEKDVKVTPHSEDEKGDVVTTVKVHRADRIDEISAHEIKEVIKNSKDIKQIVVEKISLEEATRYSLLFAPKNKNDSTPSLLTDREQYLINDREEREADKNWSLKDLELFINSDFISTDKKTESEEGPRKLQTETPADTTKKKVIHEVEVENCDHEETHEEIKEEVTQDYQEEVFEEPIDDTETNSPLESSSSKIKFKKKPSLSEEIIVGDKNDVSADATPTRQGLKLKLKDSKTSVVEKPAFGKVDKNLKYERHTLTKKKNRSSKSYYYRAKDHMELYKVGSSYLKDFRSGLKSFSFSSIGIRDDREKTVFGICSFFNYHEDLNICILTTELVDSFYEYICQDYEDKEIEVFDEDLSLPIKSARGFDLIQYKDLKKIERKIQYYDFETFIDFLSDRYDLLLWDLPNFDVLDTNKELYFPIIRALDNVSLVIKKDISKISEITKVISYFKRYQVSIKGLLYSTSNVSHPRGDKK